MNTRGLVQVRHLPVTADNLRARVHFGAEAPQYAVRVDVTPPGGRVQETLCKVMATLVYLHNHSVINNDLGCKLLFLCGM